MFMSGFWTGRLVVGRWLGGVKRGRGERLRSETWETGYEEKWERVDFNQKCTKCWCIAITRFLRPLSNTDQFVHHLKSWEGYVGGGEEG